MIEASSAVDEKMAYLARIREKKVICCFVIIYSNKSQVLYIFEYRYCNQYISLL